MGRFLSYELDSLHPRDARAVHSRVMSVLMFSAVGVGPISLALSGFLASWSLKALFVTAGAILTLASLRGLTSRAARTID